VSSVIVLDSGEVIRAVEEMSRSLLAKAGEVDSLVLLGVHRRGTDIARLMLGSIGSLVSGLKLEFGSIDITLYRDDLRSAGPKPVVGESEIPLRGIDGRVVALVDDVLFTGRTVRAALSELADWGRPQRVYLCVLVDRGGRELPIQPDVVGRSLELPRGGRVDVRVPELDGRLAVEVAE